MPGRRSSLIWPELRRRLLDDRSPCRPGCCRRRPARRRRAASAVRRRAARPRSRARCTSAGRRRSGAPAQATDRSLAHRGSSARRCRNTRSTPSAVWSHVSVRARASAAVARRSRRAGSRTSAAIADPSESGGTSTPVRPSMTEQRWPRMSVATAGVAHAAASVSDSPQPSASEALPTSHALRYSSRSASPDS